MLAFTGPNCYSEAEVVAHEAIRRNPTGRVVMITGTPGYSAAEDRKNGFLDTVMRVAPNMKILDIQSGNWMRDEAQRVMSDFITKYGDQIDIVYSHDDNMTVGVINALKDAGYTADKRPIILSVGAMADGLPAVQDGWIDATCQRDRAAGRVGVIVYNRKEGRALGEVTKFLVYNARKRQQGGDRGGKYFERTECVAGVSDMRFQELMPDVLHWLGITRIDRLVA